MKFLKSKRKLNTSIAIQIEKARPIRLLILDVDGVLTNGQLWFAPGSTEESKGFHVRDGLGILLLQKAGIPVALLTGRDSIVLNERIATLHIKHYYPNLKDKLPVYETLKASLNLKDSEIACMGDDLPDYPLLKRAGLSATVPGAPAMIRECVDIVTTACGGEGAVRELCELILKAQGKYQSVIQCYDV